MHRLLAAIAIPLLILRSPLVVPAAADPVRTHTTPFTPTGELLPAGAFQRSTGNALLFELGVGISDRVELRLHSLAIAIADDLQLRISVLPHDLPFRLVVGASAIGTMLDGGYAWLGGSVTAAYREDDWNAHATARLARRVDDDDQLGLVTAGIHGRVSRRWMLFADAGQHAWSHPGSCTGDAAAARVSPTPAPEPEPDGCHEVDAGWFVAFGAWFTIDDHEALGLSATITRIGDQVVPLAPLITYSVGG